MNNVFEFINSFFLMHADDNHILNKVRKIVDTHYERLAQVILVAMRQTLAASIVVEMTYF